MAARSVTRQGLCRQQAAALLLRSHPQFLAGRTSDTRHAEATGTLSPPSPTNDGFYPTGQSLQYTAAPGSGWTFAGWTYDITGTANPANLIASDETLVFANFNIATTPLTVTGLSPATITAGSGASTLTINGTGFASGSLVSVNGTFRTVTFVNSTTLQVPLTPADVQNPAVFQVYVENFPSGSTGCAVFGYQTLSIAAVSGAPAVSLTPTTEAFPSTNVGSTSATQTVTLKNTGTATLTGISFSIAGTNPTSFSLPSGAMLCGTTLAAGSSCTFGIAFQPAAAGALSAIIHIADNATGSPQSVTASGTGVAVTPTVAFNGIGSSALFTELGLAASAATTASPAGLGATCLWSTSTSSKVVATDNSASGGGKTDTGSAWVAWTPVGGSCSTVNSSTVIYAYLQTDSVVGNRCLFNGCTIKNTGSGSGSAGIIAGAANEVPLAAGVATALNGAGGSGIAVNAAGTDIRPEDAEFAIARALTPCGQPVVAGSQYLGLGYNNGDAIQSRFGGSFNVINFALPSAYSVLPIGATPVLVVINGDGTTNGFGDPGINNLQTGTLASYLDGTFQSTQAALTVPQVGNPAYTLTFLREPLSGTYNTMEYNITNDPVPADLAGCGSQPASLAGELHRNSGEVEPNGNRHRWRQPSARDRYEPGTDPGHRSPQLARLRLLERLQLQGLHGLRGAARPLRAD